MREKVDQAGPVKHATVAGGVAAPQVVFQRAQASTEEVVARLHAVADMALKLAAILTGTPMDKGQKQGLQSPTHGKETPMKKRKDGDHYDDILVLRLAGGRYGTRELLLRDAKLVLTLREFVLLKLLAACATQWYVTMPDLLDGVAAVASAFEWHGGTLWQNPDGADVHRVISKLRGALRKNGVRQTVIATSPCKGGGFKLCASQVILDIPPEIRG